MRAGQDASRAGDRTTLAWLRSAISLLGVDALVARTAVTSHAGWWAYVAVVTLAIASFATYAFGSRLTTINRQAMVAGRPLVHPRQLVAVTVTTSLAGCVATVLVLS